MQATCSTRFFCSLFLLVSVHSLASSVVEDSLAEVEKKNAMAGVAYPADPSNLLFPSEKDAPNLTIGYFALSGGTSLTADITEAACTSDYSHVAMILCPGADVVAKDADIDAFKAKFFASDRSKWYSFESDGSLGNNVHLLSWETYLNSRSASANFVLRPFSIDKQLERASLETVINSYLGISYEKNYVEEALSAFDGNWVERNRYLFCSELLALVLRDFKLLKDGRKLANNYVPADFSLQATERLRLAGASLGDEYKVPLSESAYVQDANRGVFRDAWSKFLSILRYIRSSL